MTKETLEGERKIEREKERFRTKKHSLFGIIKDVKEEFQREEIDRVN